MTWEDEVLAKIRDLESIASWASITGFGGVRDHCRTAQWDLVREVERVRGRGEQHDLWQQYMAKGG